MLGPASSLQRNGPRSLSRNIFAIFSALALVLGFTLASTPSAQAVTTCTNLSPAIGEVVTCTGAGAASINIPAGARGVRIVAVGGGGAGGGGAGSVGSGTKGGDGGAGARVDGTFALSGGGTLSAQVGAGGAGRADVGAGGAFSRVQLGGTDLVIAGGGGGGGLADAVGKGGTGAANGTAAGGDGANSGGSTGGKGGSDGSGGPRGTGSNNGDDGSDYPPGNGGVGGFGSGGDGGSGYGGGGRGGSTGGSENTAAGGGAGGSFANPTLLVGTASFSPSAGPQGLGGEGGTDGTNPGGRGKPGAAGLIEITFLDTLPDSSQVPPPILQQFGLPADGECESGATQEMNWAGVESGGWGKSWAQWMNDGAGGAVCTRTLIYNPARARWMVEGT